MDPSPSTPSRSLHAHEAIHRWEGHMSNGLGATYGQKPMAFLSVNADQIVLSGNLGTYEFTRATLVKIGRGGVYPWFFSSVRIHHRVAGFPEELQFKPLGVGASEIRARLEALGYPVA